MKGTIGTFFGLMIMIPIIIFVGKFMVYGVQVHKVTTIATNITREAERQGGISPTVTAYANSQLENAALLDKGFKVQFNQTGLVDKGGKIEVTVSGKYDMDLFNFLGTGAGSIQMNIIKRETGYSEVWLRN
ncbi:DUF4320 family protein [Exiguobacterium antarcticum]|uniref:DUF4320 family protein n=1 Tax=Exiguobacterium antarcticum TaxID=132920 RepID=A0ABT6R635_9BACL|nr:DUF4320 family protein [Exiguobacterium antarcticum]MDI3236415.1 DUF4320 family protein [Exiguobacterium antarcticum]